MQITDREWVQLSAYLDGELSGRELEQVRKRLKSDPRLQDALKQLKITKQILQSAPALKAPRNFILTPDMVGQKQKKPAAAGFRLAAALMSVLLIGVLIMDFGRFLAIGAMAPAAPKNQEVMLEAMPESAADAVEEPALMKAESEVDEVLVEADSEKSVLGEADEAAAGVEGSDAPPIGDAADQPVAEAEAVAESLSAEPMEEPAPAEAVDESLAEGTTEEESEQRVHEPTEGENLVEEKEAPQPTGQMWPTQTVEPPPATIEYFSDDVYEPTQEPGIPIFRILEILLAAGVIGFSAAAWLKRRKSSH